MKQLNRHYLPEPHAAALGAKLNWLRAGVLGANDGIVSTAGVVIGMAAGGATTSTVLLAGGAALISGSVSMALGEYVSVAAQRDTETALIQKEKHELAEMPAAELTELTHILIKHGLSSEIAQKAAENLTENDALTAHLFFELGITEEDRSNPLMAAGSSAFSFLIGALLPLLAISQGLWWCVTACILALAITGAIAAKIGQAPIGKATLRLVIGGSLGLLLTWGAGAIFGVQI